MRNLVSALLLTLLKVHRSVEYEEEVYTTRGERNLTEFKRKFTTKEGYLGVPCQRDSMLYGACAGVGALIII